MAKTIPIEGGAITIGAATVGSALIEAVVIDYLRKDARTALGLAHVYTFAELLKYTHSVTGVDVTLPRWNSTVDEVVAAFDTWMALPETVGDVWAQEVEAIKDSLRPLVTTGDTKLSNSLDSPPVTTPNQPETTLALSTLVTTN